MSDKKEQYAVFVVNGETKKDFLGIPVVSAIKLAYPERKIVVVTHNSEIWLHNPLVWRVYQFGKTSYFYDSFIKDQDTKVFSQDPYLSDDFLHKRSHLSKSWCDMCGLVAPEQSKPALFLTERELTATRRILRVGEKPIFMIQTHAGAHNQPYPISWARDLPLPVAEEICMAMKAKGYEVFHIRRADQPALTNAIPLNLPFRQLLAAIGFSDKRLLVDSFAQQAAAAFNLQSVVTWVATSPKVFGYEGHINIEAKIEGEFKEYLNGFLEEISVHGAPSECPYSREKIFNAEEILKALEIQSTIKTN